MLALHRWKPGERESLVIPCHSPAHALSEAWLADRRVVSVISEGWEDVRRPTRWEAEVGRILCAPGAWAIHRNVFWPRPMPHRLDSAYGVVERRRPAMADPFDWVIDPAPPSVADAVRAVPRRLRSPTVSAAERPVYDALLAAGGPIHERQADLGTGFSAKRERIVRNGSATLYLGYGTWLLLGRDLPLTASGAASLVEAAHVLLERRPVPVSHLLAMLRESSPESAVLDSPVLLAALLRRCPDVLVDEQSGMAGVLPPHLMERMRAANQRPGILAHRRQALPPPIRAAAP